MHILLMGHDTFAKPLRGLGLQVTTCGPGPEADLRLDEPDLDWVRVERLLVGQAVQAVLVTDDVGYRRLPAGLWQCPLPTAFYGIDAPINRFWQMHYARLFDLAWLDQPVDAQDLSAVHDGAGWLPLAIDPARYQGSSDGPQREGVCFVGVVNDAVRPKRSAMLSRIKALTPLNVAGGRRGQWVSAEQAAELYRTHQVVLNENLFPGLTTRPLEVMAAGGCLLTESAPGAMDVYFQDGVHLAYYDHYKLEYVLKGLLANPGLRKRLADSGREAVLSGHTLDHRAQTIADELQIMAAVSEDQRPRLRDNQALAAEGQAYVMAGLRWPGKNGPRRLQRGAARLAKVARSGDATTKTIYFAGLAALALGRNHEALSMLGMAAAGNGESECLALGLAMGSMGRSHQARGALTPLLADYPGLAQQPASEGFHLAAARLLTDHGRDVRPGFNGSGLPPAMWTAFEHLQEVIQRHPHSADAWQHMADILSQRGASFEAERCITKARDAILHGGIIDSMTTSPRQAASAQPTT